MYAIIKTGGKQYKVAKDAVLKVESLTGEIGSKLDLETTPVDRFMTENPEALRLADSIVFALNKMSLGGFRHVPLVDDEGRPVGVISVKDIVDYIADFFSSEVHNVPPEPGQDVGKNRDGA